MIPSVVGCGIFLALACIITYNKKSLPLFTTTSSISVVKLLCSFCFLQWHNGHCLIWLLPSQTSLIVVGDILCSIKYYQTSRAWPTFPILVDVYLGFSILWISLSFVILSVVIASSLLTTIYCGNNLRFDEE